MNRDGVAWKVGLFVVVGLVLLAVLLLAFSKGIGFGTPHYNVILATSNVGGIKPGANVLMSGVQVGKVQRLSLTDDGKTARIFLDVYSNYRIDTTARFNIDSMGFLGDAYVSITLTNFTGATLTNGAQVTCLPPFDMQEMARSAVGFINRIDITAERLNDAMGKLNNTLLSDQSLSNATMAVSTFRDVSDHALTAVDDIHKLFATNSAPVAEAITNLVYFSSHINSVADEIDALILTNRADITEVFKNFQAASVTIRDITTGIQAGHGLVGALFKDEKASANFSDLLAQLNSTGTNLDILTGRINSNGLWSVLWKEKQSRQTRKEDAAHTAKH